MKDCTIYVHVLKTKALINFVVTTQLLCPFVGEHGGLVVEPRTPEREVGGSIPTSVLCP